MLECWQISSSYDATEDKFEHSQKSAKLGKISGIAQLWAAFILKNVFSRFVRYGRDFSEEKS